MTYYHDNTKDREEKKKVGKLWAYYYHKLVNVLNNYAIKAKKKVRFVNNNLLNDDKTFDLIWIIHHSLYTQV